MSNSSSKEDKDKDAKDKEKSKPVASSSINTADTGMIMSLNDAQRLLTDNRGEKLEFKEQKDGTWKADDVEGDKDANGNVKYIYQYSLVPQTIMVTVSVAKLLKEDLEKAAEEDHKTKTGENASSTTTTTRTSGPSSTTTKSKL